MEAFIVAVAGKYPLSEADYLEYITQLNLRPEVIELQPAAG
jgi:hypothetical protein